MNIRTSQFFHQYSKRFNEIYGNENNFLNKLINKYFRKSMRLRFEYVFRNLNDFDNSSVLDVGCGPGHYCIEAYKKGSSNIVGIDFAPNMIEIAKNKFALEDIDVKYDFIIDDFIDYEFKHTFDYIIFMGFMDYISDPDQIIKKAIKLTNKKSFFSFPQKGGFLAFQRKIRYSYRCKLYYYSKRDIENLINKYNIKYQIEEIERDYFVTIEK